MLPVRPSRRHRAKLPILGAGGHGTAALLIISSAGFPSRGADGGPRGLTEPALGGTVRLPPPWGVTRRCLPGGISLGGDPSHQSATGPAGVQCQGIRPSCRARAAFELFAAPGPATQEWARLFATLKSDAPGRLDAIDDPANLPLSSEPDSVQNDISHMGNTTSA